MQTYSKINNLNEKHPDQQPHLSRNPQNPKLVENQKQLKNKPTKLEEKLPTNRGTSFVVFADPQLLDRSH